jgi:hypothetical protein
MKYLKKTYIGIAWLWAVFYLAANFYYIIFPENRGHDSTLAMGAFTTMGIVLFVVGGSLETHSLNRNQNATKLAWAVYASLVPVLIIFIFSFVAEIFN